MGIEHFTLVVQQSSDSPMCLDADGYTSNEQHHFGSFNSTGLDKIGRCCDQSNWNDSSLTLSVKRAAEATSITGFAP